MHLCPACARHAAEHGVFPTARERALLEHHEVRERGWVPTMLDGLVVLIWALAGEALQQVFETAIERILGGG